MTKEVYALEWLRYADSDLAAARFLLGMEPPSPEIICFHCQQAAEKALKAFLAHNGTPVPKIHDLTNLNEQCAKHDREMNSLVEQCIALNDFAVEVRYPEVPHVEDRDAKEAIEDADTILRFIRKKVS